MITLATIGYGDVYPVTTLGKIFGVIIAVTGIGMFALPTAIIGSGFVEELQARHETKSNICPHCGKNIDEMPQRPYMIEDGKIPLVIEAPHIKNK